MESKVWEKLSQSNLPATTDSLHMATEDKGEVSLMTSNTNDLLKIPEFLRLELFLEHLLCTQYRSQNSYRRGKEQSLPIKIYKLVVKQ